MRLIVPRLAVFIIASCLQVRVVDAKNFVIPAENPRHCVKNKKLPCAISTGDRPRFFQWQESQFELDRELVLQTEKEKMWDLYKGLLVIRSDKPMKLHTPFADIYFGQSKVMVHVFKNKVRVLSLNGEGVRVILKADGSEHYLVPGFQNWFGGMGPEGGETGVASVIDVEDYGRIRAKFFLDPDLSFIQELRNVASAAKWAAAVASRMHRELVERKMASLKQIHIEKVQKKRRKIQFNEYLRKLFIKKINYDY